MGLVRNQGEGDIVNLVSSNPETAYKSMTLKFLEIGDDKEARFSADYEPWNETKISLRVFEIKRGQRVEIAPDCIIENVRKERSKLTIHYICAREDYQINRPT
jgi:hypothetical protein